MNRDDLRRLAEKATPGPWRRTEDGVTSSWAEGLPATHRHTVSAPHAPFAFGETIAAAPTEADARYLAAVSPDRVLALLDHVEALERVAEAARALLPFLPEGGPNPQWRHSAHFVAADALRAALSEVER